MSIEELEKEISYLKHALKRHEEKEKSRLTLSELEEGVREDVRDEFEGISESESESEDRLSQIADRHLPDYTVDLLEVALSELSLVYEETEWDCKTPIEALQVVIYRHLNEVASEEYEKCKEDLEELKQKIKGGSK